MNRSNVSRFVSRLNRCVIARIAFVFLFSFICLNAKASELTNDWGFQTHGFISQAYIKSNHNNFFGESTGRGSVDFREIGANISFRPLSSVQLAGQLLYREAGGSDKGKLRVDFASGDYRAFNAEHYDIGIRVGRIKNPAGFYNDTRDVAVTRPGVILPQSIYFDRVRDFALSSDGVQLYADTRNAFSEISLQVQVATPRFSDDTEVALFSSNLPGRLDPAPSYMWRLMSEFFTGKLKLAISNATVNMNYTAAMGEPNGNSELSFSPVILSAQINSDKFTATAEYARRRFFFNDMSSYVPYRRLDGESYYLQFHYRLFERARLLSRYDITYLNILDKTGSSYEAITQGRRPAFSQFAKDFAVGAQWDDGKNWLLMVEQHWIDGTAWLPHQDNPNPSQIIRKWWMANVLVSFRF